MSIQSQADYWSQKAYELNFINPCRFDILSQYVDSQAMILDYGCGYGRILNELQQQGYQHLFGLDFAPAMIARGCKEFPNLHLQVNQNNEIPFPNKHFDAILLFTVLTCINSNTEQLALFNEVKRVLKPHGILYLSDFLISKDPKNQARYQKYQQKYGCYGVFELDDGRLCRHHSLTWIKELTANFTERWYWDSNIPTMSGNPAHPFQTILRFDNN